jgi:hypothetical protein
MSQHRIIRSAALGLAIAAIAAPAAGARADGPTMQHQPIAAVQDLRSPDARDAAQTPAPLDPRSPDAKDGYLFARSPSVDLQAVKTIDLRSPDAVDASAKHITGLVPPVQVVHISDGSKGGFDWGDAAIGAGTAAGLALLVLGGAVMVTHRRRPALKVS